MVNKLFRSYFDEISYNVSLLDLCELNKCVNIIDKIKSQGGKIMIAGNGASAAISSHVANDFTKSAGIRAVTFHDAAVITCLANDFTYECWIEKAIGYFGDRSDCTILISSSGKSENILNAARKAIDMSLPVITLTGFSGDNPLSKLGDVNLIVKSDNYNVIEMTHHIWLTAIIEHFIVSKEIEGNK